MKSYAQIHLQLSNLQYDEIPLKRCEKRAKKHRPALPFVRSPVRCSPVCCSPVRSPARRLASRPVGPFARLPACCSACTPRIVHSLAGSLARPPVRPSVLLPARSPARPSYRPAVLPFSCPHFLTFGRPPRYNPHFIYTYSFSTLDFEKAGE